MRFISKCSIKKLSWFACMTFFLKFDDIYKQSSCQNISFSFFQNECDESKIINFCLICIAHEFFINNERIRSTILSMISSMTYIVLCFWICFRVIVSFFYCKTNALFNMKIFHSSMITFDATKISKKTKFFIELSFRW